MKKILVIGEACQGKMEWVQEQFKDYKSISPERLLTENHSGKLISGLCINQFHLIMKQWIKEQRDYKKELAFIRRNPSWIIVSDEWLQEEKISNYKEREWREKTILALCALKQDADLVYRINCGKATLIKGKMEELPV